MKILNFVIVGHVDHGKSTFIGRLLYDTKSLPEGKIEEIEGICKSMGKELEFGYIMDHLEEERDQGITIDTAQIFFKTKKRNYCIIDAPGHVEFVKNMITGSSQADAAVSIIDAEEGIQEQTRRHAYILSMLGLKQIIVAVNKMDTINYNQEKFNQIAQDITKFLESINLKPMHILPISAKEGIGIAQPHKLWFKGPTILEALDNFTTQEADNTKPLRFAVQDIYKHEKRIAVGRVEAGTIKQGQEITILPSKETTKVESIEQFLSESKEATAGFCPGIVTKDKLFLDRGNIIVDGKNQPTITSEIKAHLFWMAKHPLKKGDRLLFKCSTQEIPCEIKKFEKIMNSSTLEEQKKQQMENREVADVIIKTDEPVIIEDFNKTPELGRFVLEQGAVSAGGIITEVKK